MMNQSALILQMALLLLLLVCSTDAKLSIITTKSDIQVGEEMLLLCKAGGEGDITWQKDGEDIDDETKVSIMDETSSKFLVKKATMEDAGRYTCRWHVDDSLRGETHLMLYVYEGPSFRNTSTYHEFLEGKDAMVPCLVTGWPAVEVLWLRDKDEIPSNEGRRVRRLSDNTLLIEKVRREDAGTYVCEAHIRGRPINKKLSISVVVNAPPTVNLRADLKEGKEVMAGAETNFSLLCLVGGQPKPNITWIMPTPLDPLRQHFNSDRSQLTIRSVTRADYGEYICTAKNKIAESSAIYMLNVFEAPEVFLSAEHQSVSVGGRVSVSCNVSGHPQPERHWVSKHNGHTLDSASGRIQAVDGTLVIDEVVPSDGGLYSCMAVSITGNASRDVAIHTQPGPPFYMSVSPGPTSVLFFLKVPPITGGTPILSFVLQWRQSQAEQWKEITVPASDPLVITTLKPYTLYTVRLAAVNKVGRGQFSVTDTVHTKGKREPDSPVLLSDKMKVEDNSFSVPLQQIDDGGTPLLHFNIQYRQIKEGTVWKEMQLKPDADSIALRDLPFSSDYQLEVRAVNANGSSNPAMFNFTIADQPVKGSSMTKGSVVGVVVVLFLVVFLVVDATCCYRNRCGLLMSIAVKLFGKKVPGLKMLEEGEGATNGQVNLKSISTPRGSFQQETLTKEGGQLTDVTCDKAQLTKYEKTQSGRDPPVADA